MDLNLYLNNYCFNKYNIQLYSDINEIIIEYFNQLLIIKVYKLHNSEKQINRGRSFPPPPSARNS